MGLVPTRVTGGRRPAGGGAVRALGSALTLVLAAGVAACVESTRAEPRPVVLKAALATTAQGLSSFATSLATETLLATNADGRPSPRLFDSWVMSEDGLTFQFHVANGLQFHDGTQVDAATIRRALLKRIAADQFRSDRIASIEAVSDAVLEIRLKKADGLLISGLGDVALGHPDHPQVGTGPFRIESGPSVGTDGRTTDTPFVLTAFDGYRAGRPPIDRIVVTPYTTQRNAWAAMMRRDVDYLHEVTRDSVDFVEAESSVRVHSIPRPYYIALAFNVRHRVLANPEVRQALSRSIDRDAVVRLGLNGRGTPGTGAFWPKHWAYSTAVPTYSYNPDAARLQLNAAGLPRKSVSDGHPARFRFTCLTFADPRYERVALVVQRQLFEAGVDMQLEAVTFRELVTRMAAGRFDAILMEFASGRTLDYPYYWWRSSDRVALRTGYTAADSALDKMREAYTDEAVRAAVTDAQRIMFEDPPAVFLAWQQNLRAVTTQYDVPVDPDRDLMATIARWRPRQAPAPPP